MEDFDLLSPVDKILLIAKIANSIGINTIKLTSGITAERCSLANEAAMGLINSGQYYVRNGEFNTNGEMSIEFETHL